MANKPTTTTTTQDPTTGPEPAETPANKPSKRAKKIAEGWREFNPGGAPVSPEFIQAALDQGLDPKEVRAILRAQALGGPNTGPGFSSPELLDYFTANPTEIPALLAAVRSVNDAPESYAEYLAGGGEPGGYRSAGQQLQEAVLGIGGAREAYLSGTTRAKYIAAGYDPRRYVLDKDEFLQGELGPPPPQPDIAGNLSGLDDNSLFQLNDTVSQMLQARKQRASARSFQSDFFDLSDFGEE